MSTRQERNSLTEVSITPSKLDEAISPAADAKEPTDMVNKLAATEKKSSPTEEVESFFVRVIEGLTGWRTGPEAEAIERAADLILECESRGGRVHVTGIGKSEHIARYVAFLLSRTGTDRKSVAEG